MPRAPNPSIEPPAIAKPVSVALGKGQFKNSVRFDNLDIGVCFWYLEGMPRKSRIVVAARAHQHWPLPFPEAI